MYIPSIVQWGLSLIGWLEAIIMRGMVINMNDEQLHTLAQLQAFLDGTITVDLSTPNRNVPFRAK